MNWKYYSPKFEYEEKKEGTVWSWIGHRYFAYDFISNIQPKIIVELGTHYGTSFWSFCQAVKDQKFETELSAIDTWKGEKHAGFYGEEVFETVKKVKNNLFSEQKINLIRKTFDEAFYEFENNSIDLLHIDGLHTYEAVKHDFENWLLKLNQNGVILFHDIKVRENDFGVYKFWEELKEKYVTMEFFHSFGLGVLFLNESFGKEIKSLEKEWQMHYSYIHEMEEIRIIQKENFEVNAGKLKIKQKDRDLIFKDVEIEKKNEDIKNKTEIIQSKEKIIMLKDYEIKLKERLLFEEKQELESTKTQVDLKKNKLNLALTQIGLIKGELNLTKFNLSLKNNELIKIYSSYTWRMITFLQKMLRIIYRPNITKAKKSILVSFISHSTDMAGAERSLLDLIDGLILRGILCHVLLPKVGKLEDELIKRSVPYDVIPYRWWVINKNETQEKINAKINSQLTVVNKILRKINPDIIYTNTSVINIGALIAKKLKKPHIWHIREFGELDHNLEFTLPIKERSKFVYDNSEYVIFNSKAVEKYYNGDIKKNGVIYNNVSIESDCLNNNFEDSDEFFKRKNSYKLIIIGTIHSGKNQEDVIFAVEDLVKNGIDVELDIVGKGDIDYTEKLKKIILLKKLENNVRFLGYVDKPYCALYQTDVLIVCSKSEAFGRTIVEGMLMKKPIIATRTGGIPEIISDGVNGLLYTAGNYNELAEKIKFLYKNKEKVELYINNAYNFAIENFSDEKYSGQIKNILYMILLVGSRRKKIVSFLFVKIKKVLQILREEGYIIFVKKLVDKITRKRKRFINKIYKKSLIKSSPNKSLKTVYYISNIEEAGVKKYIYDLIDTFGSDQLDFIQIKNKNELDNYKILFRENDILIFQYLFFSDLTIEDVLNTKKQYNIKLVIPVHDFYLLESSCDSLKCPNINVHSNYLNNKSFIPEVFELLKMADLIIYPSEFVKKIFDAIFVFKNSVVTKHIDYRIYDYLAIPKVDKTINIGIINNITIYKGAEFYPKLFLVDKYKEYKIQYHVFGMDVIKAYKNVTFHGPYKENEIFSLLKQKNIHGLVFLNKWGETYSYSLTKGINSGLPILYSNLGAYIERLANNSKFFPIYDNNIEVDLSKMLKMILKKQGTHLGNEIIEFEKEIPNLYLNLFSINDNKKKNKKISVVVPNYNYENFLKERLNSIINQTYKPFEIIFLDDKSQDNSINLAEKILKKSNIPYKILPNKVNKGCFSQWYKGIQEAKGDLVWIAEADDSCDIRLLEKLVVKFDDPEVGLAYSQSIKMDEYGKKGDTYLFYLEDIPCSDGRWRSDYVNTGINEIRNYLVIKNTINNASAVLMRRDLLLKIGEDIGGGFKQAGDWYTYVKILQNSKIAFCAEPLNFHRYHSKNIVSRSGKTSEEKGKQLVSESLDIQVQIISQFNVSWRRINMAFEHTRLVCKNNSRNDLNCFSEYTDKIKIFKTKNNKKRILFFSSNDNWGGDGISFAKIVQAFSDDDFSVAFCLKKPNQYPKIIEKMIFENKISFFERIEEKDYCRSEKLKKFINDFAPDLVFISQGHVFEGTKIMSWCNQNGYDYANFIPLVTEHHLKIINPDKKRILDSKNFLQCSQMIFSDNTSAQVVLKKIFGDIFTNFSVIRNAFDVPYDQPFIWNEKSNGLYQLMYIGRLYFLHKGLDLLLEVLAMEKWKNRPLQIMAYGEGIDRENMERYIKDNSIKNFFLCGYTQDLAKEIVKYDGVIFPSRMEGIPIALTDALLCNRMAIVTPVGGMPEFIIDGENGFVADNVSTEAIDECLERAWQRREEWKGLSKNAGKKIRELVTEFPQQQCIDEINNIIK